MFSSVLLSLCIVFPFLSFLVYRNYLVFQSKCLVVRVGIWVFYENCFYFEINRLYSIGIFFEVECKKDTDCFLVSMENKIFV